MPGRLSAAGALLLSLVWIVASLAGQVTDVRVYRRSDHLYVDVTAARLLDERTAMTVDSGLPGTCVYRLRLEDREHRPVAERWVEMSLRLDLWENVYRLDGLGGPRNFATLAAADSAWSRVEAQRLCTADRLQPDARYRLLLTIAVQPLAPADRERLRANSGVRKINK